jgi:hypothetical protein
MTTLYITVFNSASVTAAGDPIQYLSVPIGALAQNSDPLVTYDEAGRFGRRYAVRVFAASDCFFNWGQNPTVTGAADGIPLAAGVAEYFRVKDRDRIAVIERT